MKARAGGGRSPSAGLGADLSRDHEAVIPAKSRTSQQHGQPGLFGVITPSGSPLFSPGDSPLASPVGGRRALRAALARDRRAFAIAVSATLAGIIAAAVFGSLAPLNSTWMTGGEPGNGYGAPGGLPPQASVPWSAAPLGTPSGRVTTPGRPAGRVALPGSPRRAGEAARPTRPRGFALAPRTSQGTGPGTGTGISRQAGTSAAAMTSTGTRRGHASRSVPGTAGPGPTVVVRYLVDSQRAGGFQGQIHVVNNSAQPIAGWQIVIALPGDTVTSIRNAGGFVSNQILLLQPAEAGQVVPPDGGTLDVFFVAEGTETTPAACAFNGTLCG